MRSILKQSIKDNNIIEQKIKKVRVFNSPHEVVEKSNIIAIITEWEEFREIDWLRISKTFRDQMYIYDGRNILNDLKLESDKIKYFKL